jgi:hypothetical protein
MSTLRAGQPGATRLCPHCKATVLESASICPGCRHHLRFGGGTKLAEESYTALSVDGTIAHRESGIVCEYCIVLDITNERGEQVMRQVVGVGALQPGERRRLNVSVQMLPLVAQVQAQVQPRAQGAAAPLPAAAKPSPLAAGTPAGGSAATQATPSGVNPARPSLPPGAGASAASARPGPLAPSGAPTPTPRPASAATPAPGTPRPAGTSSPSPTTTPQAAQPPGGTASSQRLRIFRKP